MLVAREWSDTVSRGEINSSILGWHSRAEVESRTQGLRPRPRTQKKFQAKDSLSEDKNSQGQGQNCLRPRTKDTNVNVLQKKVFKNFFQAISNKNGLEKIFSTDLQNFNHSKNTTLLKPRTGQCLRAGGFEAKANDFKMCP